MITSWRITTVEYAASAFDGKGAFVNGGRWNSRGVRMIYTPSSAALAALELLVRIRRRESLRKYVLLACSFEEQLMRRLTPKDLPDDWRASPAPAPLQQIGDAWIAQDQDAVLEVPSAIIETEFNYLLNPRHRDFRKIKIADAIPFSLDLRLLRDSGFGIRAEPGAP
ncbi:MAG TPA: RES family NAD+ phosphorylase [Thermoanaerobaculia bacterium]